MRGGGRFSLPERWCKVRNVDRFTVAVWHGERNTLAYVVEENDDGTGDPVASFSLLAHGPTFREQARTHAANLSRKGVRRA
jgi:hypothetical protein